ncbi:MAG: hypothetical protein C5B52_02800 [Bacteroidetes bacterium]|nr:MAG: hypothetical protein C5B52_02800 [Bacteroidota bacterium]
MKLIRIFIIVSLANLQAFTQNKILVFQTDYGLKDGAVSAMKGVSMGVSKDLKIFDITHEIPAYNIWEAAYRLEQTARYWPRGTVFVSVVDPGVGSSRKSVVLKTKSGYFFVTPDNGTLTLVSESMGIAEVREIDEKVNRLKGSGKSYTFHGRDVYAYTAARLASGVISFEQVGPKLESKVIKLDYKSAAYENGVIRGNIPILDIQYGNVWTNIGDSLFAKLNLKFGDLVSVKISSGNQEVFSGSMPYVASFASVKEGENLAYLNSLLNLAFAINMGSFAEKYKISSGPTWTVEISKK